MFSFSVVYNFFATPWAVAHQAPQLWEIPASILDWVAIFFSGDLPNPGIEPTSPAFQADSLPLGHQRSPVSLFTSMLLPIFLLPEELT